VDEVVLITVERGNSRMISLICCGR